MKYDEINIKTLQVFANHGVYPEENILGQRFDISLTMRVDARPAGKKDDLELSVNYGEVSSFITVFMKNNTYKLIEAVAENLAEELLLKYDLVKSLKLTVAKPWAPVGLPLETVSVTVERGWQDVYLSLGSNMGDKKAYLDTAIDELNKLRGCVVEKVAGYLETEPYGGVEQDDFLNTCVKIRTFIPPRELLDSIHEIEAKAGRERIVHWGPRTLDIDILMYGNEIIDEDDFVVPHIEMHKRQFVLDPLSEIAPHKIHPLHKKSVIQLKEELNSIF